MMDAAVPTCLLRCEGFQRHEDRCPKIYITPRLLYSAAGVCPIDDETAAAKHNITNGGLLSENKLQNVLGYDDFLPLEEDPIDELGLGVVERVGPAEYIKRLMLIRSALGLASTELGIETNLTMLPESSRDCRHSGDLYWHGYYEMSKIGPTVLPSMRYTNCTFSTELRCFHKPRPMLQVFGIKLKSYLEDVGKPLEVYGFVAVRDAEDYRRNYLFNRPRDNPVIVNQTSDYLTLMSPTRGISMTIDCLVEIDLRVKALIEDVTLVDGCVDFVESCGVYDVELEGTLSGTNATAILDLIVFEKALEATIELDFTEVPTRGFELKMCGYTAASKNLYSFVGERCDCNGFICSTGKHLQYFVAAVPFGDTLFVDFMEGKLSVPFRATSMHGSQEKEYRFYNGATVNVKVSWSTSYY